MLQHLNEKTDGDLFFLLPGGADPWQSDVSGEEERSFRLLPLELLERDDIPMSPRLPCWTVLCGSVSAGVADAPFVHASLNMR